MLKSKSRNYFRVMVLSKAKPGLSAVNEVERSHKEKKMVPLAAAACAEYLNEKYHDDIDPDQAAITTEQLLKTIIERNDITVIRDDGPLGEE